MDIVKVNIETGKTKVFVSAQDWPGWSRSGKDEASALEAFLGYRDRYAAVMKAGGIDFEAPTVQQQIDVEERQTGNSTTDFGAPAVIFESDKQPMGEDELVQATAFLEAGWAKFDEAAKAAQGKELQKGPRGGGRDLEKMIDHVIVADMAYFPRVAWTYSKKKYDSKQDELPVIRKEILAAVAHAVVEGLPEKGKRGGVIWPIRYYVRRVVWHTLDHAWEIEDRILA